MHAVEHRATAGNVLPRASNKMLNKHLHGDGIRLSKRPLLSAPAELPGLTPAISSPMHQDQHQRLVYSSHLGTDNIPSEVILQLICINLGREGAVVVQLAGSLMAQVAQAGQINV